MADPIRLYWDEDAQRTSLVRALRARRVDVLTANEAGKVGISDAEQLAFAASLERTVFTFNGRGAGDLRNWLEFLSNWR